MNSYSDLTTLKSKAYLNYAGTAEDTYLRVLLQMASRAIDEYTRRFFYVVSGTRYYDGASKVLLLDDILSITTFKTDDDTDGTYEEEWTVDEDYVLYPLNSYPKMWAEISSRTTREFTEFNDEVKQGVQIIGTFGYGDGESATPYIDSTTTTAEELDATETAVDVTSGAALAAGQTILVESEQMYIQSISTNTLTVKRGVNGTTAATHATLKTIYIYQYPELIKQATLIQASRWWKRKDSAFSNMIGNADLGTTEYYKSLDPDVRAIIQMYKRTVV